MKPRLALWNATSGRADSRHSTWLAETIDGKCINDEGTSYGGLKTELRRVASTIVNTQIMQ